MMRRGEQGRAFPRFIHAPEGLVEQSELFLEREDPAHSRVEHRHRHCALGDQARQVAPEGLALHFDVGPRCERAARGFLAVRRNPVRDELLNRAEIADDNAGEAPFLAQDIREQMAVGDAGHAIEGVEGRHEAAHAGRDGRLEWRQIGLAQRTLGEGSGRVVATRLNRPIRAEMLDAGRDGIVGIQPLALEAPDTRGADLGAQPGRFARPLRDSSPAWVTRHVQHRRIDPIDARGGSFPPGYPLRPLDRLEIEAGGLPQRDWENRPVAVQNIETEEKRDAEAGALDRRLLQLPRERHVIGVEDAAKLAPFERAGDVRRGVGTRDRAVARQQHELPYFLRDRHPREEVLDPRRGALGHVLGANLCGGGGRLLCRRRLCLRRECEGECHQRRGHAPDLTAMRHVVMPLAAVPGYAERFGQRVIGAKAFGASVFGASLSERAGAPEVRVGFGAAASTMAARNWLNVTSGALVLWREGRVRPSQNSGVAACLNAMTGSSPQPLPS
ncbi:hypothetical protein CHELA1G11_20043 [Hyphomicrobiales bacterium]|nr:hypothetical protein CHELA1G11_20043 [Hyphomicrobiales bacterium]